MTSFEYVVVAACAMSLGGVGMTAYHFLRKRRVAEGLSHRQLTDLPTPGIGAAAV